MRQRHVGFAGPSGPTDSLGSVFCTSYEYGGGFLGCVPHIIRGHTAVDAAVLQSDAGDGQRAAFHDALLRELLVAGPEPAQRGAGFPAGRHTHQSDRLPRVRHQRVVQEQFDGGRSWRKRRTDYLLFD